MSMKSFLLFSSILWYSVVYGQNSIQSLPMIKVFPEVNSKDSHYFRFKNIVLPATFLIYGALKPVVPGIQNIDARIMDNIVREHQMFHTKIDSYLMWAPTASLYALDAMKIRMRHHFKQHLLIDLGSIFITGSLGYAIRKATSNIKDYHTYNTKFPSGHVANAFRGAEILYQELKQDNPLLGYSGYVAATAVGVIRIYNKAHLLSEVIAGAGLGILSSKITYWLFDCIKKENH